LAYFWLDPEGPIIDLLTEGGSTLKNGVCPKCDSDEVYFNPDVGPVLASHGMNEIPIKGTFFPSTAVLDNYVCGRCGYVESYILDNGSLLEIVNRWTRVTPK
jgi:hypothetical protein